MPPANGSASWEVEVIDEHRVVGPASLTWPLLRVPCHLATSTAREAPERDAIRVGDARRLAHLRRRCGGTGRSGPRASGAGACAGVAHAAGGGVSHTSTCTSAGSTRAT